MLSVNVNLVIGNYTEFYYPVFSRALSSVLFVCGSASVFHIGNAFMGAWVCKFLTSAKLQDGVYSSLLLQTVGYPGGSST